MSRIAVCTGVLAYTAVVITVLSAMVTSASARSYPGTAFKRMGIIRERVKAIPKAVRM